jgi:hypothetical protein
LKDGGESPKWPSPNLTRKESPALFNVSSAIPISPKLEDYGKVSCNHLDDNFIEGVEKMHADLHDFIKNKD